MAKPKKFKVGDEITLTRNGESATIKVRSKQDSTLTVECTDAKGHTSTETLTEEDLTVLLSKATSYRITNPRIRKVGTVIAVVTIVSIAGLVWYKNR